MKVLFIGLGSISGRHIRNLKEILNESVIVSVLRSGKGKEISSGLKDNIDRIITDDNDLEMNYDAIFITNPTSMHYETLERYQNYSDAFFIEKPVFITGEEDISPFSDITKKYYIACPLRYSNVIQWLKYNMNFSTVYSMRVISSSYLPDWRPGMDYRNTYSAHRVMGGGVNIDLIHEWDYISYLIGFPFSVQCLIRKMSNLEIDSDDIAMYMAEYTDKVVEIHLDYFGRKTIRKIELLTENDTVVANLIEQKISWLCSGKILDLSENRDSYQKKEMSHFLDIVNGKAINDNSIEEACKVLRIARGVE